MDDELRQALPKNAKNTWIQLRPRGRLDQATVALVKQNGDPQLDLDVHVLHRPKSMDPSRNDSVHLNPLFFPLPLANVQGEARFNNQTVTFQDVTAQHGKIQLKTNGKGRFDKTGRWRMNLTECVIDQIHLTSPVLNALPKRLAFGLRQLQLVGMFSLSGAMHFVRDADDPDITAGWDLSMNVQDGRLVAGKPVEGIYGEVRFNGAAHGNQAWSRGELQLDSMMSESIQFTDIEGPFWLDSSRLVFGQRVPPANANESYSPVSANVYGGRLTTNSEVGFQPDLPFRVELSLSNLDMATIGRDWQIGKGNLAGQGHVDLTLTGTTAGKHTYRGTGRAALRGATLYELPLILTLLNPISSGRTDNTAFTSSDAAFRVDNGYVYFDQLDLSGDAITLKGLGEMSLERELSLDFYTIVGSERRWSPIVRPFLGQASRQFLQIHVNGPLDNPRASQEVLPGLNETLRQLFPEQSVQPTRAP